MGGAGAAGEGFHRPVTDARRQGRRHPQRVPADHRSVPQEPCKQGAHVVVVSMDLLDHERLASETSEPDGGVPGAERPDQRLVDGAHTEVGEQRAPARAGEPVDGGRFLHRMLFGRPLGLVLLGQGREQGAMVFRALPGRPGEPGRRPVLRRVQTSQLTGHGPLGLLRHGIPDPRRRAFARPGRRALSRRPRSTAGSAAAISGSIIASRSRARLRRHMPSGRAGDRAAAAGSPPRRRRISLARRAT
jgi:hypothetical protein